MSYGQQPGNWSDQSWPTPNEPYSDPGQGYPGYPQSAAPAGPGYEYGYPAPAPTRQTNGLAVAAMVVSLASILVCWFPAIVGAIMGHVARKQIRERGEEGAGMALTAVIVGWILFALAIIGVGIYVVFAILLYNEANNQPTPYSS